MSSLPSLCLQLVMKYCRWWSKFRWKITWYVTIIATLLIYNPPTDSQGMTNNVGLAYMLVTVYYGLRLAWSKTIRIGDTKYHIWCRHR